MSPTPPPALSCLDIPEVRTAHFRLTQVGLWRGTVADRNIEYDVLQVRRGRWYASDDDSLRYYARTAAGAVRKAIKANS